MRWGDRALEAEVIDGRNRREMSLGDAEEDDFVIGAGAKLRFVWSEQGLEVRFSTGVAGTASLGGEPAVTLGQLVETGRVKEQDGAYALSLRGTDSLSLQVAEQIIEVQKAPGRIAHLSLDPWATAALIGALALLAVFVFLILRQMEPLNLLGPPPK